MHKYMPKHSLHLIPGRYDFVIYNDQELEVTKERIRYFQQQVERLQQLETKPQNYQLLVGGFRAEIDRMNLEVREYLSLHPSELKERGARVADKSVLCLFDSLKD